MLAYPMPYDIQDEYFAELIKRGLIQDIANLTTYRSGEMEVRATPEGWHMTVSTAERAVRLERKTSCLELSVKDTIYTREYPCDIEGVVGAAIDLMKIATRK